MKIKINVLFEFLIVINLSILLLNTILPENNFGISVMSKLIGVIILGYLIQRIGLLARFWAVVSLILISLLLNYFFIGNIYGELILNMITVYFPIALYLVITPSGKIFKIFSLILLIIVLFISIQNFGNMYIFPRLSRNYISVYLIFAIFFYSIDGKIDLTFTLATLMVFLGSVIAIGRGGILASGAMLILLVLIYFRKEYSMIVKITLMIMIFAAFFMMYFVNIEQFFSRFFVIDSTVTGSNGVRLSLITNYIESIDSLKSLLLGSKFGTMWNLHNSYLMTHGMVGLAFSIFAIICIIATINILINNRMYMQIIVFVGYFVRALTDVVFPYEVTSIIFYYYILIPVFKKVFENRNTMY